MCRMFGFRSFVPSGAHHSLVAADNALRDQSARHADGWGVGYFIDDNAHVVKSSNAAHASERFKRVSQALRSHTFLVHVRRATVGVVDRNNAHPFQFGRWLFAHNGTLFGFDEHLHEWFEERTDPAFRPLILGSTDSEHLFYYLLSQLAQAGIDKSGRTPSDASKVAEVVRRSLADVDDIAIQHGLDRPICNVILTDGRLLIAHRAGMPLLLSTQKLFCPDHEICPEPTKVCMLRTRPEGMPVNHLLVASERIGETENVWEDIADGTTLYCDEHFRLSFIQPREGWVPPVLPEWARASAAEAPSA